jgi:hypothetical protein
VSPIGGLFLSLWTQGPVVSDRVAELPRDIAAMRVGVANQYELDGGGEGLGSRGGRVGRASCSSLRLEMNAAPSPVRSRMRFTTCCAVIVVVRSCRSRAGRRVDTFCPIVKGRSTGDTWRPRPRARHPCRLTRRTDRGCASSARVGSVRGPRSALQRPRGGRLELCGACHLFPPLPRFCRLAVAERKERLERTWLMTPGASDRASRHRWSIVRGGRRGVIRAERGRRRLFEWRSVLHLMG